MRIDNAGKSKGRVPSDFPEMKCVSRIASESNRCYRPYYSAKEVWKWFKGSEFKEKDPLEETTNG